MVQVTLNDGRRIEITYDIETKNMTHYVQVYINGTWVKELMISITTRDLDKYMFDRIYSAYRWDITEITMNKR